MSKRTNTGPLANADLRMRYCRSYPMCPPEGCWSDSCAVDQPDDGPGSYPPADEPDRRKNKRLHAAAEHSGREVTFTRSDTGEPFDLSPRCWSCNAVLPDDGICTDADCPTCD